MKNLLMTLMFGMVLSVSAYAKESVVFVMHKVVIGPEGKVTKIVPMKSHVYIPADSKMSIDEHHENLLNTETLFNFKDTFKNVKDKVVSIVSRDDFKKIATASAATAAAVAATAATIYSNKKIDESVRNSNSLHDCLVRTGSPDNCM